MSWIRECSLNWVQYLCVKILRSGPIPKHVAFIMDGNRRYSKKKNVQKIKGHSAGFEILAEVLQWCLELGIYEVTVYAFSIENFKREKDEVDALLKLAKEKFEKLLEEEDKLMEQGVCIRVIGNFSFLPSDLVSLIAKATVLTKDNTRAYLNVAFSYTARDEMCQAVKELVNGVQNNLISIEDITVDLFNKCLYTNKSPDPELLIRTSGETRLSDFLLWQASNSYLHFTSVLWPEFTAWHLLYAVFQYQRHVYNLPSDSEQNQNKCNKSTVDKFIQSIENQRIEFFNSAIVSVV